MKTILTVSFDVELGWGSIENRTWQEKEARGIFDDTRSKISELLALLDEVQMPSTWGFVGKLLDHKKIGSARLSPGLIEICSLKKGRETTWYGIDLLEKVVQSKVKHEIACHSFFHIRCDADIMTSDLFQEDLELCKKIFKCHGFHPVSYIYPSNEVKWINQLAQAGFKSYRSQNEFEKIKTTNPLIRKFISLMRLKGYRSLKLVAPQCTSSGLYQLPGTVLFNVPLKRQGYLPGLVKRVKGAIKRAIADGDYLHIWSHPFNYVQNSDLIDALREVMIFAAKKCDEGHLDVLTMEEFIQKHG